MNLADCLHVIVTGESATPPHLVLAQDRLVICRLEVLRPVRMCLFSAAAYSGVSPASETLPVFAAAQSEPGCSYGRPASR